MWMWGCLDKSRASFKDRFVGMQMAQNEATGGQPFGSFDEACRYVLQHGRFNRTAETLTIPTGDALSDIRLSFRWSAFAWELQEQVTDLLLHGDAQGHVPDIIIANTGFWHIRHPHLAANESARRGYSAPHGGLLPAVGAMIRALDDLPAPAAPRSRLVWRGLNLIELREGNFSNGVLREVDGQLVDTWRGAGYAVARIAHYTPPREDGAAVYTTEGWHPQRWVLRELAKEVLQVGRDLLRKTAARSGGGGGDGGGRAQGDNDGSESGVGAHERRRGVLPHVQSLDASRFHGGSGSHGSTGTTAATGLAVCAVFVAATVTLATRRLVSRRRGTALGQEAIR